MSPPDPQKKAFDLLARRPHFRRELAAKLASRGYSPDVVDPVLDRLEELGYLDDARCAKELVGGSFARKGFGPWRIRAELARRGAPPELIDETLESAFVDGETSAARVAAERFLRSRRTKPAALARHLDRKGYSRGVILGVLQELESGDPESD